MIVSRDINSLKETQTQHMLIDVIGRYRKEYNDYKKVLSHFALEIPYPDEFVSSTNTKYVRVISTTILLQLPDSNEEQEPFWHSDEQKFVLKDFPEDTEWADNFTSDSESGTHEPYHIALGASFVQDTNNDFQLLGQANPSSTAYLRTYEQHTTQRSFRIWLVDLLKRQKLSISTLAQQKAAILLELELIY